MDSSPPSKPTQVEGTFRLEELKLSLQKTIETCFDNEPTEPKAKSTTSVDTIVSKFQTYVKTMPKYKCPRYNLEDRIFYCCLVVGWDGESPQIKFKFPPNVSIISLLIPKFELARNILNFFCRTLRLRNIGIIYFYS